MSLKKKLEKIDIDIGKGLKFKATDRLRNLIQENPNETQLWHKLAELYYESGFLDAAGKYWILMEPKDDRMRKCIEIYEKSVNYSGYQVLQEIVFRGDKSKLSEYAQNKLAELETDSKNKADYVPKFSPRKNKPKHINTPYIESTKDKSIKYLFLGIIGSILILILIGFTTVVGWIF